MEVSSVPNPEIQSPDVPAAGKDPGGSTSSGTADVPIPSCPLIHEEDISEISPGINPIAE